MVFLVLVMEFVGKCLVVKENGKRILVIGDLHLGYEEMLNRSGVFVSRKMFEEMISELDRVFLKAGKVDSVILLGDVKQNFGSIMKQEWQDVNGLFDYLEDKIGRGKEIVIVKGNHDTIIKPIAEKRGVDVKDFYVVGKFCFLHGDKSFEVIYDKKITHWIMGHGHPAVKLSDGLKIEKYKCFLVGKFKGREIVIVPSFFEYNEGSDPRENDLGLAWKFDLEKFNVKAIQGLEVLDFGALRKLEKL